MKQTLCAIILLTSLMYSCGPSKAELEAKEKAKMDSVAQATKDDILKQQRIQDSIANNAAAEALINAIDAADQEAMKEQIISLKSQLAAEESKLSDIKSWKLGRLESEKAQQIADQTTITETLKQQIIDLQKQIK